MMEPRKTIHIWGLVVVGSLIALWKNSLLVNGFSLQLPRTLQQQQQQSHPRRSSISDKDEWLVGVRMLLASSISNDEDALNNDDELSKLIGKRNQIKRKRKQVDSFTANEGNDDDTSLAIPLENINLDQLPTFQTQRPVRQRKRDSDDDGDDDDDNNNSDNDKRSRKNDASGSNSLYLDYLTDYADENEFHIPNRIGFSARAWGDASWGFTTVPAGKKLSKMDLRQGKFVAGDVQVAFNQLMQGGVVFGDTSELYGASSRSSQLSAEHILAQCMQDNPNITPLVSTTMINRIRNVLQTRRLPYVVPSKKIMVKALSDSCQRLELASVELFQVSTHLHWGSSSLIANGLAQVVEQGLCNYVGIQKANRRAMQAIRRQLDDQHGIQLTSNAFEFSLTNRRSEKLIQACKDVGVIPLIQNPLDVGDLASGRYTATNPSGGQSSLSPNQKRFSFALLEKLQPLHSVQETVAERVRTRVIREMRDAQERSRGRYGPPPKINTDITTTQVAINYVVAKGGVPLVPVNTPKDAQEVLGCLGWSLTEDDVDMLDAAASLCGM